MREKTVPTVMTAVARLSELNRRLRRGPISPRPAAGSSKHVEQDKECQRSKRDHQRDPISRVDRIVINVWVIARPSVVSRLTSRGNAHWFERSPRS